MGLFMDSNGLPITYQLFPDNTNDCLTYCPNLSRTIQVTTSTGKKMKKIVDEKQVIFYSEKYDRRAKAERAAVICKALELDLDKLMEEEALDGYYVIITSEYQETSECIIEMYRGLWRIEESFRVTKSDLEARPVFVSREDHIEAHFLTCFVALLIARILEMKLDNKHSITRILESLGKAECTYLQQNYYLFDYYDEVLMDINRIFDIDFSKRIRSLADIKKIFAETKK
jgi:hypothetical protein